MKAGLQKHMFLPQDHERNDKKFPQLFSRELSITPMGYFTGAIENHSCGVSHGNYFAWRVIFPRLALL
jgi:hypothetical protein